MNVEYFIAKRLFNAKEENNSYTKPILRIAILAIALSLAVMLLSIVMVTGFKNDISNKIIGFGSHIQITNYTNNNSYETGAVSKNQDFYPSIENEEGIKHIQVFATKAAIIKTKDEIHGVVLKGVGSDFDATFFESNLEQGEVPVFNDTLTSSRVIISKKIANLLKLETEEKLIMYFVQDPPRVRKFVIAGIYATELEEFDELYVFGDIRHIQKLNNWGTDTVGGFEISLNNFDDLDAQTQKVYEKIAYDLNAQSIKEINPQIFDWLDLQDINVRVILILMLIVGGINMITALLILILERTRMIGILKAIGASNWSVRKVFLYSAMHLIVKGMFWGNVIGLGIAFLQYQFQFISLDESIYYMNTVPINFNLIHILLLNLGTLFVCYLILIIPSIIITKITPVKAIRFE